MSWKPITKSELEKEIQAQLAELNNDELELFNDIRCPLRGSKIARFGKIESVFIVAVLKEFIVFYDDIEEGFEISILNDSGVISEYGANQFRLRHVLNQVRSNNR